MELEALLLGMQGKAAGFRTLRSLTDQDSRLDASQPDQLIDRAERQADLLERLRIPLGASMDWPAATVPTASMISCGDASLSR